MSHHTSDAGGPEATVGVLPRHDPERSAAWVALAQVPLLAVAGVADRAEWGWLFAVIGLYGILYLIQRSTFWALSLSTMVMMILAISQGWIITTFVVGVMAALELAIMWRVASRPQPEPEPSASVEERGSWLAHEIRRLRLELRFCGPGEEEAELSRQLLERRAGLASLTSSEMTPSA